MRKQWRYVCTAICAAAMLGCMTACEQKQVSLVTDEGTTASAETPSSIRNFLMPEPGEDIVVLTIKDYGDVKIRLFPGETEWGAENFRLLAESGYYDELIFHRVIDGFMIQGGDPRGDGTGGSDAWQSANGFAQTISPNLHHFTGAVAYAVGEDRMNQSQFYIVTGEACPVDYLNQITQSYGTVFTPDVQEMYGTVGGAPFLDGGYEVFGQVFDGMEHILAIQKTETNSNDKPKTPVVIEKAVVTQYDGAEPEWLSWAGEQVLN